VFPVGIGLRDPRSQTRDLGHPSVCHRQQVQLRTRSSQERVRFPASIDSQAGNFAARIDELCD
jgi:hypothetical protein